MPNIVFKFEDKNGQYKELNRKKLEDIEVLSQGERRALYLLQMIFEIENRAKDSAKTLFIIDDIADSFDYKNKYAIIEYLNELPTKANNFYQIILTHNFDFFRILQERILMGKHKKNHSFIAKKNDGAISLHEAGHDDGEEYVVNPFLYWKKQLNEELKKEEPKNYKFLIALIPFTRELLKYTVKKPEYSKILTSLLHIKNNTKNITIADIKPIYKDILGIEISKEGDKEGEEKVIFKELYKVAEIISNDENSQGNDLNLENKVILSIAIRLMAELHMKLFIKLEDQIGKTVSKFKNKFSKDSEKSELITLLDKVVMMTPENIHLNSFMYEPLLDMSDWHLRELYNEIYEPKFVVKNKTAS